MDQITQVMFDENKAQQIESRQIGEDDIYEALTASQDMGDLEPVRIAEGRVLRGGRAQVYLYRVPASGRYLHVGLELMDDGTAWCYRARDMSDSERRRFERAQ